MKIIKKILADIHKCYAVSALKVDGKTRLLFAAEGHGACYAFDGADFSKQTEIWQGGGGTMSIVPLEWTNGWFLAVRGFYSMVDSTGGNIVLVKPTDDGYSVEEKVKLPYIHRFDVLRGGDSYYLLAATIASSKKDKQDWSSPGKLYGAKLSPQMDGTIELEVIHEGLTQNHGYCRGMHNGKEAGFVGCREGIFAVTPPPSQGENWTVDQIYDQRASDMTVLDIDGDGQSELAIISPFHGNHFGIYKLKCGAYECVYQYPEPMDFYHAVLGADIGGKAMVVGAARRDAKQLFCVEYDQTTGEYISHVIDQDVGASNVYCAKIDGKDVLLSANREIGQAAIYELSL